MLRRRLLGRYIGEVLGILRGNVWCTDAWGAANSLATDHSVSTWGPGRSLRALLWTRNESACLPDLDALIWKFFDKSKGEDDGAGILSLEQVPILGGLPLYHGIDGGLPWRMTRGESSGHWVGVPLTHRHNRPTRQRGEGKGSVRKCGPIWWP